MASVEDSHHGQVRACLMHVICSVSGFSNFNYPWSGCTCTRLRILQFQAFAIVLFKPGELKRYEKVTSSFSNKKKFCSVTWAKTSPSSMQDCTSPVLTRKASSRCFWAVGLVNLESNRSGRFLKIFLFDIYF